ncbi:unnamed protein product [Prorocentrum cordatum]|uniref:Core Histone H2A/H2B/H3 domain-containing protein n=1 Tax=Prorocentrum cordatum TaxID=2364126 RepID=A0ABN9WEM5_9DINO|nr:unnamed protein product [Polarella glacialis]
MAPERPSRPTKRAMREETCTETPPGGPSGLLVERGGEPYASYASFIAEVLKQVHATPNLRISKKAMGILELCVEDSFERIAEAAAHLHRTANGEAMTAQHIEGAVRLLLPRELAKHAVDEGTKALGL